jgi:hypothetical protein
MLQLSSCQQFAKNFQTRGGEEVVLHSWILGTKFLDKRKNKNYPGKTKVYIHKNSKLRLDVYDPFGLISVGNLVINGDRMSLRTIDGVNYKGEVSREKIQQLLKVDVNPKDLFSLFTQSGFEDKHWGCAVDESGRLLQECVSRLHKMKVEWSGSMTQKGTVVTLDHVKAFLTFKVKGYQSYSKMDERLFEL